MANINDKNNSAAVYVGSTLKVHNPLFSVGKLLRNKFNAMFLLVHTIKMIGILLNLVHFQVHKNI